jgi:hypothetical protein
MILFALLINFITTISTTRPIQRMVSVKFDYDHKHGECHTCCQETTVERYPIDMWEATTDEYPAVVWLCCYCIAFLKNCSFCKQEIKSRSGYQSIHAAEPVSILRKTGNTICEDCCGHVMAATTSVFATVDTRPGHYHSSRLSDEEYKDEWFEGNIHSYYQWLTHDNQARNTLYDELEDDSRGAFGNQPLWYGRYWNVIDYEEEFLEKYERKLAKKPAKGSKPAKTSPKSATAYGKKGNKKLSKVGKPISTADRVAFDTIRDYAWKTVSPSEVIPETPRAALHRMNVPAMAFSTLDMKMEIRTVWTLDRPITMTVDVPVPACLLKRRKPLEATEFGALMVAVWKAYRHNDWVSVNWHDFYICNFLKSDIFIDFVAKPIEC